MIDDISTPDFDDSAAWGGGDWVYERETTDAAKAELFALLSHEPGADERIETALVTGTFDGFYLAFCFYGYALGARYSGSFYGQWDALKLAVSGIATRSHLSPLEVYGGEIGYDDTPATSPRAATVVGWIHEWRERQTPIVAGDVWLSEAGE